MRILICALLLVVAVCGKIQHESKSGEKCKTGDTNFNNCLLERLEKARPNMMRGIPELRFRALAPLEIPYFEVHNNVGNLVKIDAVLKNVKILGNEKIVIQDLNFDLDKLEFYIKVNFPESYCEMDYDVKGNLLQIPLETEGVFIGNYTDTSFEARAFLDKVHRNGQDYFKIKDMTIVSKIGGGKISLISKNPSFQYAADVIVDFFNNNPRVVFDAVNPIYVDSAAQFFTQFLNPVLAKIPISEILTE